MVSSPELLSTVTRREDSCAPIYNIKTKDSFKYIVCYLFNQPPYCDSDRRNFPEYFSATFLFALLKYCHHMDGYH